MPHFSSDAEIDYIGASLLKRSLPKSQWTHAAHFAAAVWLLRRPDIDAMREMPGLIRAYNEACGVPNTDIGGYHETITLGSLRAAKAWLADRSKPLLFSVTARRTWIEPDLKPLPF